MSKFNCSSCKATGLYRGLCEPEGCAVICIKCSGIGGVDTPSPYDKNPVPFVQRMLRTDVQKVYKGNGTFIFGGAGPIGSGISYQDFWHGKMPS